MQGEQQRVVASSAASLNLRRERHQLGVRVATLFHCLVLLVINSLLDGERICHLYRVPEIEHVLFLRNGADKSLQVII